MFDLCRKSTRAEIRSADEFDAIRRGLIAAGFTAVIRSIEDAASDALGVRKGVFNLSKLLADRRMYATVRDDALLGEIFIKDDSLFIVMPILNRLSAWELRSHTNPSGHEGFLTLLEATVRQRLDGRRVRGMDFNWKEEKLPLSPRSRIVRRGLASKSASQLQTKDAGYSADELMRAKLIASGGNREFLLGLAKIGNKARSSDAASLLDENSLKELLEAGIIRKEYLLVCRQDSRTICSIPDKARLEATIGGELSCTSCGRAFTDELIQDIYALTGEARALLNGSQWMTIWLTSLLVDSGVPIGAIKWNAAAGDDELDIVADIHGLKVFFELKDREFGLGDAYPFSFRVERYGGDVAAVVTMVSVAEEAQKFLEEQRRRANASIWVIEGEDEIPRNIPALVGSLSKLAVQRSVTGGEERFGFDVWPFLSAWMEKYE